MQNCEDEFNLNNSKTFFSEYILEQSNAKDYFNKHVVGFTFESSEDNNSQTWENMDSTVWYSNNVSILDIFT